MPPLTRSFCSTDTATVGGESEDIEEGFQNLFLSIIVALALVHAILVIFFGSLLVPLIILLAAPLATVGAFGALFLTDTALSLPSLLGLLLLISIVLSNAILLVDFATKAKEDCDELDEAVVAVGRTRLRPILMTAPGDHLRPPSPGPGAGGRRKRARLLEPHTHRHRGTCDLDLSHVARRPGRLLPA